VNVMTRAKSGGSGAAAPSPSNTGADPRIFGIEGLGTLSYSRAEDVPWANWTT